MGSPFNGAANLELFIPPSPAPISTLVEDELGNLVPDKSVGRQTAIRCTAARETKEAEFQHESGPDDARIYFTCKSVRPKFLPAHIQPQQTVRARLTDLATRVSQEGDFVLSEITQSRWRAVTKALGTNFKGYFLPQVRGKTNLEPAPTPEIENEVSLPG